MMSTLCNSLFKRRLERGNLWRTISNFRVYCYFFRQFKEASRHLFKLCLNSKENRESDFTLTPCFTMWGVLESNQ